MRASGSTISSGERGHDAHESARGVMVVEQLQGLGEDQRRDDVFEHFADDALDLVDLPALSEPGGLRPHPFHLLFVRAHQLEHELGVNCLAEQGPADHALAKEAPPQGEGA